jgi:hypothetical protein
MTNNLTSEEDITKVLPITPRELRTLRRSGKIPFVQLNRYKRLYNVEKVVAALEKLTKPKSNAKK